MLTLSGNGWAKSYAYSYDGNGNITQIMVGGIPKETYTYDSLNQLTSLTVLNGSTYSYTYDNGGNILSKTVDGVTTNYTYGDSTWKDLLTAYNGNAITYDTIGNPLTYYDGKTFDWDGRQLKSVGTGTTYKYNADGIRTEKTTSGMTTRFYLNGSQIIASQNNYGFTYYDYDATGKVISTVYLGNTYYYVYNLQGDVVGITNSEGELVVEYTYDPWGKVIGLSGSEMSGIGLNNPFRYRGYYYDTETGFYYLNSRYYDPNTGRFLNADGYISTGQGLTGYNMFAYCGNNPIINIDTQGTRYCAATSVSEESFYDRSYACYWQGQVVIEKDNPDPIGRYSGGNVYLVKDLRDVATNFPGDVTVIDKRGPKKGDGVVILNSFVITDTKQKTEILTLLYNYEKENPTGWNRTVDSMMLEWDIHNEGALIGNYVPFGGILYSASIHACFDNNSEGWSKWDHYVDGAKKVFG